MAGGELGATALGSASEVRMLRGWLSVVVKVAVVVWGGKTDDHYK